MDASTALLPILAPLALVVCAAIANFVVSSLLSDADVDCVHNYTATDAKRARRGSTGPSQAAVVSAPSVAPTSPTAKAAPIKGRNPLR